MADKYRKHFYPLESSPEIFNDLAWRLGADRNLEFCDVLFLDDLQTLPGTILAFILILPTSAAYEACKEKEDAVIDELQTPLGEASIVWFKQTINNACGLYAVLHAICNGEAVKHIRSDSTIGRLLAECSTKSPNECALVLEGSEDVDFTNLMAIGKLQSIEAPRPALYHARKAYAYCVSICVWAMMIYGSASWHSFASTSMMLPSSDLVTA